MEKHTKYFTAAFAPVLILCLFTLGGLLYFDAERQKENIRQNEDRLIILLARFIQSDLSDARGDIFFLAQQKILHDFLNGQSDLKTGLENNFARFAVLRRTYDQIRLIAANGREIVRVNYHDGKAEIVPTDRLQNKKSRYYFTETMRRSPGKVYVSRFDLNVENGSIEIPYKPVIRFAVPLFKSNGTRWGILILNFVGRRM